MFAFEREPMAPEGVKLDPKLLSAEVDMMQKYLMARIIGQERAIRQIVKAFVPTTVNMNRENRPLGVFLFLGPTGVGKSETVKVFAKFLLGKREALTKIDCTEYQADHEVSKLLGSPPGYVGYKDVPRLAQKKIDQYQTKNAKMNVVLFDEIEKADPRLRDSILAIIGDGELTLGTGEKTDFSRTFIFLTSNLGSKEVRKLIEGEGMGFQTLENTREDLDDKIYRASKSAIEKEFRPEFINRLDKMVVFHSLAETSLREILRIEVAALQWRVWQSPFRNWKIADGTPVPNRLEVSFKLTEDAKKFVLKEGTSDLYGARELNRAVDRYLGFPLASLIGSKQVCTGDKVQISYVDGEKDLTFTKVPDWVQ